MCSYIFIFFFFSSRRRHTRCLSDWSSDVCSSDLLKDLLAGKIAFRVARIRNRDLAERLDARQELTVGFRVSRRLHVGDKLRKRYDQSDWYQETERNDHDQLLVRLDECGLAVAHFEILRARPKGPVARSAHYSPGILAPD